MQKSDCVGLLWFEFVQFKVRILMPVQIDNRKDNYSILAMFIL